MQEEPQRNPELSTKDPMFNLSLEQVKICIEEKIDLNSLYLLEAFEEGKDLSKYLENPKMESWRQTLLRKGYINENGKVLNPGLNLLEVIRKSLSKKNEKLDKNVSNEETPFDLWWKQYPGTNNFEVNGKRFKGTRTFRVEKDTCRLLYTRIVNSGEYTDNEMLEALKLEVETRKEESYKTGEDKLKYLQNSATYLRQYSFDPYVELVRSGVKTQQKQSNQVDYSGGINI